MSFENTLVQGAPSRPEFHFTPPNGWMNDPNGLVFFEGEYHLFYQYYPAAMVWGPMHWGHAVSTDLVHWTHLDAALLPDDDGMCFSGSAIVDSSDCCGLFGGKPGLIAFYTAHRVLSDAPNDYVQEQCIAYSSDKGRSWQKYAGNPVIAPPGFRDFRDPKVVWHEQSQHWIMALACGQSIRFYRSTNLLDWTLASEFGAGQGRHTTGPWECPDLFELPVEGGEGSRWVLVVGVGASEDNWGSFTQYFVGDFDGVHFHNENAAPEVLLMDESRDFYAVQSWSDVADGRRLAIAWMNNWLYANQIPENGWRGNMSVVRELALVATDAGIRLRQDFAREFGGQAAQAQKSLPASVSLSAGQDYRDEGAQGPGYGRTSLTLSPCAAVALYLQQYAWPDLELSLEAGALSLSHRREGQSGDERFERYFAHDFSVAAGNAPRIELEWFSDHGSLEVLVNGGLISLTSLCFSPGGGQAPVIAVTEGQAVIESLTWSLFDGAEQDDNQSVA
ncbi:glycosyl hydrolase family 32 [Marinobacterium aestuarii]|uniref:Glycosyl hydrolase family 32 n=1 Tax=Marinobacterium aestuarii TaxID=1821621 RepID=A0A1A9EXU4_9GAMM|nr:glycoside hydrolase family 32 protein [Marinobacterium aestuarii]ANG62964.1 glycosyl hydrolase family 32 [Marinobacterium aestuarii]